jgi:hypothetical protein
MPLGIEAELIVRLSRDLDQNTDLAMACVARAGRRAIRPRHGFGWPTSNSIASQRERSTEAW